MHDHAKWWTFVMRKKKKKVMPGVKFVWMYGKWHECITQCCVLERVPTSRLTIMTGPRESQK
eukprot:2905086-Amphidinium_carterae.1